MKAAAVSASELWYLIAIALLLAYIIEGTVGHWLSYRRGASRKA